MKHLIIAASGFNPQTGEARSFDDTVSEAECNAAIGQQQPYAGAVIYLEAVTITTQHHKYGQLHLLLFF